MERPVHGLKLKKYAFKPKIGDVQEDKEENEASL
jgi:hypothetical protein